MATKIQVTNIPTGYQSIITNGRHSILADEPIHSKGTDLGMAPTDLVLAGLAMCKAATVRFIARKKGWEVGNVTANLEQVVRREGRALRPTIVGNIHIEGDLTEEQRAELVREADACYIHRLLQSDWEIHPIEEVIDLAEA